MRPLYDIKIVDMKKSVIDGKKSNTERDEYVFIEKVYVGNKSHPMRDNMWQFKWGRDPLPGMGGIPENTPMLWNAEFGATYVVPADGYWPELMTRNSQGHYVYPGGDAVLVKIPLERYVEKVEEDRQAHKDELQSVRDTFENEKARLTKEDKQIIADELGI